MARMITSVLIVSLVMVFSVVGLLKLLLEILKRPFSVFKKKARDVPPPCLMDSSLGTHEYVTANGIKFHCVSKGDTSKPLMLFLHGFPEFWFSWRYQLKEFCRDYHVVAIDMRGYGETDKPVGVHQYTMDLLEQDVVQLIKVLSPSMKCILVAQDWGGIIAWGVVQNHPELIDKFIAMNCPHPKVYRRVFNKGWTQVFKSWYVFFFQCPWLPELMMSINDYRSFDGMFRSRRMGLRNKENMPSDVLEAFKYTFSPRKKLTPPINYYRNVLSRFPKRGPTQPIDTPTFLIWAENDAALDISLCDKDAFKNICNDITIKRIPNCSHWVQQDCPVLTNQYMREFLEQ